MDLGVDTIPGILASGTTGYLVQFKGLFLLIGGIVLAFVVITGILNILRGTDDVVE